VKLDLDPTTENTFYMRCVRLERSFAVGEKKGHLGPVDWVATIARTMGVTLYALKINMDGTPQHPLYIPYSKEPEWFGGVGK